MPEESKLPETHGHEFYEEIGHKGADLSKVAWDRCNSCAKITPHGSCQAGLDGGECQGYEEIGHEADQNLKEIAEKLQANCEYKGRCYQHDHDGCGTCIGPQKEPVAGTQICLESKADQSQLEKRSKCAALDECAQLGGGNLCDPEQPIEVVECRAKEKRTLPTPADGWPTKPSLATQLRIAYDEQITSRTTLHNNTEDEIKARATLKTAGAWLKDAEKAFRLTDAFKEAKNDKLRETITWEATKAERESLELYAGALMKAEASTRDSVLIFENNRDRVQALRDLLRCEELEHSREELDVMRDI